MDWSWHITFFLHKHDQGGLQDHFRRQFGESSSRLHFGDNFAFQDGGGPKYAAKIFKLFLEENVVTVLLGVPQSPELYPIEHLWAELERRFCHRHVSSTDDLKVIIAK